MICGKAMERKFEATVCNLKMDNQTYSHLHHLTVLYSLRTSHCLIMPKSSQQPAPLQT